MIELLLEFLGFLFIDTLFGGIAKAVKWFGLVILKILTFSKLSLTELKEEHKGTAAPYILGAVPLIGLIFFIVIYF